MNENEVHTATNPAKWSKEVKRMDDNQCAYCGSTERLESHHITPKWENDSLSLVLENGITLCHHHHRCAHGGGYGPGHCALFPIDTDEVEAVQAFIRQYQDNRIIIESGKTLIDRVKAHAAAHGESVNRFIFRAINETIERDTEHEPGEPAAPDQE